MSDIKQWFANGLLTKKIDRFPYPTRWCPFCERELAVWDAIHWNEEQLIYKALLVCENNTCPAYDSESEKQYVRVYYSCKEAMMLFDNFKFGFRQERAPGSERLIRVSPDDVPWQELGFESD